MSQLLDTAARPPLRRRLPALACVAVAHLLARQSPHRIHRVLLALRRGARQASYEQAAAARRDVTGASIRCAGRYCLQRSLATTLLCRLRGSWPTWHTGVRSAPFAAHAWVSVDGRPVEEPDDTSTYQPIITIGAAPRAERAGRSLDGQPEREN